MSDRRRRSHEYYSENPVIIEREPQVRTYRIIREISPKRERLTFGSKLYNLFRSRRKRVHIIEEGPVRSRRQERRSLTPPSSPRGPYHTMAVDPEDDIYTPLPPKLPPKKTRDEDEPKRYVLEERSPQRYRKVKVVHEHFDDDDAHPKVESPSPPRSKRDSGTYYMSGARVDEEHDRPPKEYERRRPVSDPEVQRLREDLERLKLERRDAELAALAAKDKAERLQADLEYEKRQRSLEKRERDIARREDWLNRQREQLMEARPPRERQEVVVVHNPPAGAQTRDPNRSALDRARDDYQRGQQAADARRAATGDRHARRERIIIVDDDEQDRDRGHRRR
ncbi:hypothetical protein G647_03013 [Cladophialophora carrionii CBS 160.54]|uniref:Uncharacterized protein n=1 Tax=Cladophialophora carrionii CBS 160.54 TaxID=1279043 RepID=V9DHR3_9EURO|nr:uncharacterized protein G647_03013 [Cladophialophora carrionii CBS 160.54]ETI26236.1 hypothetical protein G647_03013 [Cladophialophora carrionii CBS 160.54]